MRAVIQRVSRASVCVDGQTVGTCGAGFMILLCAMQGDTEEDLLQLAEKTVKLRIFSDEEGRMNRSLLDTDGQVLCISQFTLAADTKKGNRPSFLAAMEPQTASAMYDRFCEALVRLGVSHVGKGVFGADMKVELLNDGPVTVLLDTDTWKRKDT